MSTVKQGILFMFLNGRIINGRIIFVSLAKIWDPAGFGLEIFRKRSIFD
jgi:hypothetical protein